MFNVDFTTPLTEEELQSKLDAVAKEIVKRGMELPAVLMLEGHKPLSFLASQGLVMGMPLLGPFVGHQKMADLSKILADSANVDRLVKRIEEMSAEKDEFEAKAKAKAKKKQEKK
jgi:hypothetical protein